MPTGVYIRTKEHNRKIGRYIRTEEHKCKIGRANSMALKGRHLSEETKQRISKALKSRPKSKEHREKITKSNKSIKRRIENSNKQKDYYAKGNHPANWKGGVYSKNTKARQSMKYNEWRLSVFERDNFRCVCCGKTGGYLHAHHILGFAKYPDLRFDINNGTTLCKDCHNLLHKRKFGRYKTS